MICTILYIAVALVITGMVPYDEIDPKAALATAFTSVGKGGYATLISAGAVAGLTTVVMTLMIGATRVVVRDEPATGCCRGAWPAPTRAPAPP